MLFPRFCRLTFLLLVGALALPAQAQNDKTPDKPEGPLGLEIFPDARVLFHSRQSNGDYTLALGTYKKVDGRWLTDRERRLRGEVVRRTLELPSDYSAREGFDFYLKQLKARKARQLFYCAGRECGASNTWANSHFNVIQLYGLDQYQYYGVYEVLVDQRDTYYVTLYGVQRGNKRVYVQVDIVAPETSGGESVAANPETLKRLVREQGYVVFPGLQVSGTEGERNIELDSTHLKSLVEMLEQQPEWHFALVGHDYGTVPLTRQRRLSLNYAQTLKAALQERGIATERLEIHGLGSLAPAGRGSRSARVELVLLRD